jgi:hypothetical protein
MTMRADGRMTSTLGIPGTGLHHQQSLGPALQSGRANGKPAPASNGCLVAVIVLFAIMIVGGVVQAVKAGGIAAVVPIVIIGAIAYGIVQGLRRRRRSIALAADQAELARLGAEEVRLQEEQQRVALAMQQEQERLRVLEQQRWDLLASTFGADAARLVWTGKPWQGATMAMIVAMLGGAAHVATKVMKTKTCETWSYHPIDARRFALRIEFENGVCIGWETA